MGEGSVRICGMERVAEKLWVRFWVSSSSSGQGRARSELS